MVMVVMLSTKAGSVLTQTTGDEQLPCGAEPSAPALWFPAVSLRHWQISSLCVFLLNILALLIYFISIDWALLWRRSLLGARQCRHNKGNNQPSYLLICLADFHSPTASVLNDRNQ